MNLFPSEFVVKKKKKKKSPKSQHNSWFPNSKSQNHFKFFVNTSQFRAYHSSGSDCMCKAKKTGTQKVFYRASKKRKNKSIQKPKRVKNMYKTSEE